MAGLGELFSRSRVGQDLKMDVVGLVSTALFLLRFWHTLPPAEQAYFATLVAAFAAHTAWHRWRPRAYLSWRWLTATLLAWQAVLLSPSWRGWTLIAAAQAAPLLHAGNHTLLRLGAATSLLSLSSMAVPLALLSLARPLPMLLHIPAQLVSLASTLRHNPAVCRAILHPTSKLPGAASVAALLRGAHHACSTAATVAQELALVLAGQRPSRLLLLQQRWGGQQAPLWTSRGDLADCSALFAFLQLVCGFAAPLLVLAAAEARLYEEALPAAGSGSASPADVDTGSSGSSSGGRQPAGQGAWRARLEGAQRRLAAALAAVPGAVRGSLCGRATAAYLLAVPWDALAANGPA